MQRRAYVAIKNMKRVLVIVAGIIVILGIVAVIYFTYFAGSAHLTVGNTGNAFGDATSGTSVPTTDTTSTTGTVVGPNLVKIASGPVSAGEVAFDLPPTPVVTTTSLASSTVTSTTTTATSTKTTKTTAIIPVTTTTYTPGDVVIRYIDRQNGNVYEYRSVARTLTRVSNKTLPGIQEASWLPDGSMAFVRFLTSSGNSEHIATYALPYNGNGGYFLQQDLNQVTTVGSSTVFTLMNGSGGSVGSLAHADGSGISTLFTSTLTSLVAHAVNPSGGSGAAASVIASTRAASEIGGYAFTLTGGKFIPLFGPLNGLTVLPSPSGKSLLYSYTDGTSFHMNIFDMTSGAVTALPLATLAEKCTWTMDGSSVYCAIPLSMTGNLPDDWYQGTISFNDRIWRIDLSSRLATLILDPTDIAKTDIDAVNLTLDPNSRVLVFRNKKDGSLWSYTL